MFELIGDHPKSERLDLRDGLFLRRAVGQRAGDGLDGRDPAPVRFPLQRDQMVHSLKLPSGGEVVQRGSVLDGDLSGGRAFARCEAPSLNRTIGGPSRGVLSQAYFEAQGGDGEHHAERIDAGLIHRLGAALELLVDPLLGALDRVVLNEPRGHRSRGGRVRTGTGARAIDGKAVPRWTDGTRAFTATLLATLEQRQALQIEVRDGPVRADAAVVT